MKKLTSILLVFAMLMTLAPMNILAADAQESIFSDMADTDYYAQAAAALADADILSGYPDGTFGAEKFVTRAEMAAIVCRMIEKEAESEEAKGETAFADVAGDHWASGYVNVASKEGIINGYGDGTFLPEADVKQEEAIKMIVCALGLAEEIEIDANDWSKAYIDIANENGLMEGIKGVKGEAATRGDIAVMTYAGVEAVAIAESVAAGTPVASIPEGTYTSTQKVALSSSVEGATIYYTTNGKEPTTKSKKYVKEISITKTTTLKAIAVSDGEIVGDVMTAVYTIKSNASAAGGGWMSRKSIISAEIAVDGNAASVVNAGDTLTLVTEPADATGTIVWTIGSKKIENSSATYTVTSLDMGKTIKAEITGEGIYAGTVSAECVVSKTTEVTAEDIMTGNADSSPVVLTDAENTTFLDDEGNTVTVDSSATLTLSIENPEKTEEEVSTAKSIVVQEFINNSTTGVTEDELSDVTAVAVDVDLSVNETKVHPVGAVTVTLSASQLGLPDDTDLSNYTFSASHTNKNNVSEIVDGVVVTIDNVQYVRFELNGLSTIWIGNIPPRTVTFYNTESDADNRVNSIGSVVVKFGDFTPTRQIPTPSRSGYLFCGWNYDMTRTPIISNLEVHAIWVEGVKLDEDKISAVLSEDVNDVTLEISNGLVSFECDNGTILPENLMMKVTVLPPVNAAKYYVGTDAAVVAAFNDADGYTAANDGDIYFEVNVTDSNGIVVPSGTTYYYKWIDENGNVIALNEVKASIANGADTATSMEYTANVNRGIGKFDAYLIDTDTNVADYVGYINNHLRGNAIDGYTLANNVSFDGYKNDYNFDAYDTVKIIFTPFEGESYSNSDNIEVTGEYYTDDDWNDNWTGTYQISNGKLVVTYPFDTNAMTDDYAYAVVKVNGNEQEIDIGWDNGGYDEESESIECATWAEVVNAINNAPTNKQYYISCDDSAPVTLSSSLTIPANVDVNLYNCTGFTVARGAVLTLTDNNNYNCASYFALRNGDFVVENGGMLTSTYSARDDGSRWYPSIRANNITFKSGSELLIPDDCLISMHVSYYDDDENGVLTFEEGSTLNNYGNFNCTDFDTINLNGTVNTTYYTYFYGDEININGRVNINADGYGYCEFYGTVIVGENASIVADNNGNRYYTNLEIYGPMTNKGYIEIRGMANAQFMNNGFVNYNMGTISAANGCTIYTSGTKFVNTGIITGGGTLSASLGDDYTNYDDGTEYVEVENDEYWDEETGEYVYNISDYSRYKFTHDPAATVDVILYLSEVINMGEGQCDLYIDAESFPER